MAARLELEMSDIITDLFAIIDALQDNAKGLFAVDKCDLERTPSPDAENTISIDNMKAYCELSWYSIKSATNSGGG